MGHASIQTTYDLYGKLMPGSEAEAAALVDAFLARAGREAESTRPTTDPSRASEETMLTRRLTDPEGDLREDRRGALDLPDRAETLEDRERGRELFPGPAAVAAGDQRESYLSVAVRC
jgi:hypothetical protein